MLGAAEPKATARGQAPTLKKAEGGGHSQGLGPGAAENWCRQPGLYHQYLESLNTASKDVLMTIIAPTIGRI
ncbi:hypothetical protein QTO34_000875 [Cnephaeus nilssonii]|uniref:Uncharacterized protein n=1 Tax=Cnephaeus nilssonii TaxID=3371016 RepID=A0AA40ICA8_CNENI|nr:hypothetical protein QTO34_000875 [Eptesicus nilssonii]